MTESRTSLLRGKLFHNSHHQFHVAALTMSSPHIPNLLSSRRGPRLRGRGGGRGHGNSGASGSSRRDQTVQSTDTDAAVSRLSAVSLGYLDDPFAQYFVNGPGTRRLPIINRGVHERPICTTTLNLTAHSVQEPTLALPLLMPLWTPSSLCPIPPTRQNKSYRSVRGQIRGISACWPSIDTGDSSTMSSTSPRSAPRSDELWRPKYL